jgi:hypothetical protein
MDLIRLIEIRLARWLAYVDSCLSAEGELARCQGFWTLIAGMFIAICIMVIAGVTARMFLERRRGGAISEDSKYKRPD